MRYVILLIIFSFSFAGGMPLNSNAFPLAQLIHNKSNDMSNAYHVITSQKEWLNTSRALTPDDLKGRIILLDFWTYCCINCLHVLEDLAELEKEFGEDLTVIGVHSAKFTNEKETANIQQAILRYHIEHPVVNDADFTIWKQFGARAWPTLILLNPNGMIESVYFGEGHKERLRADIQSLQKKFDGQYTRSALPLQLETDKMPRSIMSFPSKLAWADDIDGQALLLISDTNNQRILGVNPKQGDIELEIGSGTKGWHDGDFASAQFNSPHGLIYHDNIIYVADTKNHAIRKIDLERKQVSTIAGTGKQGYNRRAKDDNALTTAMASPWDVAFYPDKNTLAIAMAGTHQLWSLDLQKQTVSILAGNGQESIDDGKHPFNSLSQPSGLAVYDNKLYFVDSETSALRVLENGSITTLVGTGLFDFGLQEGGREKALMQHPIGVFANENGVYIADTYNHSIRHFNPSTAMLNNFAGTGEEGHRNHDAKEATFYEPNDVLYVGKTLYVTDTNNHQIRVIENNHVSDLMVLPKEVAGPVAFDKHPPNLRPFPDSSVTSKAVAQLILPKKWKVNDAAPSYLALFKANNGDTPSLVKEFERNDILKQTIPLTGLEPDTSYILQGSIYYCREDDSGSCLLISIQQSLTLSEDGENRLQYPVHR